MYIRLVRSPRGRLILATLVLFGLCGSLFAAREAVESTSAGNPGRPAPPGLDDVPEPLVPKRPRSEAEEDRLEALSMFAAARTLERQQEYAEALRLYQRALRRDPEAVVVGRAIIPLAIRLRRNAQAVRYALKVAELEDPDPHLLQELAAHLVKVGNFRSAVKLYEKTIAAQKGQKKTAVDILLQMEMGRLYHLLEEYGKAADCFAQVEEALDDDALEHAEQFGLGDKVKEALLAEPAVTYSLFGECFLRAGRADEAVAAFEKAHQLAPDEGLLRFNLAQVHARRDQPAEAIAALEACFQQRFAGKGTAPYELLAEVLEKLGKKDELVPRLEQFHNDDPENVPLAYFLAGQYRQTGQLDKAEPLYRALAGRTPRLPAGSLRKIYRNLVEIYRTTKRPDALLATLGEAMETGDVPETLGEEAEALAADTPLMEALVEAARERHRTEPEKLDYNMRFAVALLALEGRQLETAAEFFNLALQAKPDQGAEVLLLWGVGLLLEERPAEAAKVFQRGIDEKALPQNDPRFYYFLAGALETDHQTDQALAAARKAAEIEPDVPRFQSRAAWICYHAKRYDQAIEAYRQLIEKFDADHRSAETRDVLREARLVLSNLYVLTDDLAEAEEWLEQVLDEFPDNVGALNDLGYLWADQGKHLARALKMIRQAADAEPDNPAYRDSLGWVLYRLERYPQAVAELEKAAGGDKDQPDPIILDHLGDAYLKVNQPEKAKDTWRRAVEAFQKEEKAEKAKAVEQKIKVNE